MERKNGFTLIELLAVIVILAIIAVIATPIILGIVEDAKKDADLRSMELFAKNIEQSYMIASMSDPELTVSDVDATWATSNVTMSGNVPSCTTVTLTTEGELTLEGCTVDGRTGYGYTTAGGATKS